MAPAFARWKAEYANADKDRAKFYESLRREYDDPHSGNHVRFPCCDISDCHEVDYDTQGDHYRVSINGEWVIVPDVATKDIKSDVPNPTGSAVACYNDVNTMEMPPEPGKKSISSHYEFYCFVPGVGG